MRRWYGGQTLLADLGSLAVVGLGAASDSSETKTFFFALGGASLVLAAPIIHLAHGHGGKAAGDLGLRLGLSSAGMLIGMEIAKALSPEPKGDGLGAAVLTSARMEGMLTAGIYGVCIGAAVAMVIDSAVIANEDVVRPGPFVKSTVSVTARPSPLTVQPTFGPAMGGFSGGIGGTF